MGHSHCLKQETKPENEAEVDRRGGKTRAPTPRLGIGCPIADNV